MYNRIRNEFWDFTGKLPATKTTRTIIKKVEESLKSLIVPGGLFDELGFRYFGPIDGHDVNLLVKTLENIKDIKKPVLLHVITKKGKGMVSMNQNNGEYHNDAVKFHAVKATPVEKIEIVKPEPDKKLKAPVFQDVFGELVCEIAKNRKDTVCVTAAMREGTGLVPFSKSFPNRYYDVGIAEGHAVTFCAGLATEGVRPIAAIYSTFLQRAYDHIIHDCAIQHLPVIFCMDRAGIAGEDGPTHHGALDIAYMRSIQGMIVSAPKNGNELRKLLYTALGVNDHPFSIRYPKTSSIEFEENGQIELIPIGSWVIEKKGNDVLILAVGPMVYTALESVKKDTLSDYDIEIVNCRFIKPMDIAYLEKIKEKFSIIITIEEGTKIGGFGDGVASWLLENDYKGKFKKIGLPDNFVEHGSRNQILEMLGLDSKGIANQLQKFLNKEKVK